MSRKKETTNFSTWTGRAHFQWQWVACSLRLWPLLSSIRCHQQVAHSSPSWCGAAFVWLASEYFPLHSEWLTRYKTKGHQFFNLFFIFFFHTFFIRVFNIGRATSSAQCFQSECACFRSNKCIPWGLHQHVHDVPAASFYFGNEQTQINTYAI